MIQSIASGINKWKRNWAAREGKTDFEQVFLVFIFSSILSKQRSKAMKKSQKGNMLFVFLKH